MELFLLVAHILIVLALIGVILLQKSEGGALGIGGGGGGLVSNRSAANLLTRTTAILAALFILTSVSLALLANANRGDTGGSLLDAPAAAPVETAPAAPVVPTEQ